MTTARGYHDPCGIARALDVIGDRWALLIVRELVFGPKRFRQLRGGLRTVSPNVLSQRLRELERAGVVRREVLDPPASVAVYELTDRGRALEPVLIELGRWGSQEPVTGSGELSVNALLLALKTVFDPAAAATGSRPGAPADATFALCVDGAWFRLTVADRVLTISRTRTEHPDVILQADAATLRSVAFGRDRIAHAERDGRLTISGDRRLAERFTRMFPVPAAGHAAGRAPA